MTTKTYRVEIQASVRTDLTDPDLLSDFAHDVVIGAVGIKPRDWEHEFVIDNLGTWVNLSTAVFVQGTSPAEAQQEAGDALTGIGLKPDVFSFFAEEWN